MESVKSQSDLHSEDSSGSDGASLLNVTLPATETDCFGFILGTGSTVGSEGPPPELVRQRETKWLNIISQWDRILLKRTNKVKDQCRKGIPASLRARCWPLLCGAMERMKQNVDLYHSLDTTPALQSWVDVIERDIDRQFPFHEMFLSRDGHGQRGLFRVLKAYTQFRPDEGYCQGQGPVAAVLLMNMPAEEAFWCLVQISEQYLPGYYSPLLEGVLFDAGVLSGVLRKTCPAAHRHMKKHGVEPLMFATDWLMCLYTRHLPFNTLLRVWDLFFCYGVRVLFQVAVVLVRRSLGRPEHRDECEGQMETLERLRGVKDRIPQEDDHFIEEVCSVPLSTKDLERETEKEIERWRKERPSSTFNPWGRCHGYRAALMKGREREEERGKQERERGNLSVPVVRSASSLSPLLLRKWRKGSRAEMGEKEGNGGREGEQEKGRGLGEDREVEKVIKMEADRLDRGRNKGGDVIDTGQKETENITLEYRKNTENHRKASEDICEDQVTQKTTGQDPVASTNIPANSPRENPEPQSSAKDCFHVISCHSETQINQGNASTEGTDGTALTQDKENTEQLQIVTFKDRSVQLISTEMRSENGETAVYGTSEEHGKPQRPTGDNDCCLTVRTSGELSPEHSQAQRAEQADHNTSVEVSAPQELGRNTEKPETDKQEPHGRPAEKQGEVTKECSEMPEDCAQTATGERASLLNDQILNFPERDETLGNHEVQLTQDHVRTRHADVSEGSKDQSERSAEPPMGQSLPNDDTNISTNRLKITQEIQESNNCKLSSSAEPDILSSQAHSNQEVSSNLTHIKPDFQELHVCEAFEQSAPDGGKADRHLERTLMQLEDLTKNEAPPTQVPANHSLRHDLTYCSSGQSGSPVECQGDVLEASRDSVESQSMMNKLNLSSLANGEEEQKSKLSFQSVSVLDVAHVESGDPHSLPMIEKAKEPKQADTSVNGSNEETQWGSTEKASDCSQPKSSSPLSAEAENTEALTCRHGAEMVSDSLNQVELPENTLTAEFTNTDRQSESEYSQPTGQSMAVSIPGANPEEASYSQRSEIELPIEYTEQMMEQPIEYTEQIMEQPKKATEQTIEQTNVKDAERSQQLCLSSPRKATEEGDRDGAGPKYGTTAPEGEGVVNTKHHSCASQYASETAEDHTSPASRVMEVSIETLPTHPNPAEPGSKSSSAVQCAPEDGSRAAAEYKLRKTSNIRGSYSRRLSEDTFREPHTLESPGTGSPMPTVPHGAMQDPNQTPDRQLDSPKRFALFRRLRGNPRKDSKGKGDDAKGKAGSPKAIVPIILIQDFSEGAEEGQRLGRPEDGLTAKERRRRKREQERREKEEEKARKKREKESDKERDKDRKKPQTRGKSFQMHSSSKPSIPVPLRGNNSSNNQGSKRNSAPYFDTYF